jgi:hypothetical protein
MYSKESYGIKAGFINDYEYSHQVMKLEITALKDTNFDIICFTNKYNTKIKN